MERNEALTKNAQALRKNATKEERLLWSHFLCRYPLRFRRQYVIGNYIVDFYCHRAKLAIELDGSQHYEAENAHYDEQRTQFLKQMGICVLRFTNSEVIQRFQDVCREIDRVAKLRSV